MSTACPGFTPPCPRKTGLPFADRSVVPSHGCSLQPPALGLARGRLCSCRKMGSQHLGPSWRLLGALPALCPPHCSWLCSSSLSCLGSGWPGPVSLCTFRGTGTCTGKSLQVGPPCSGVPGAGRAAPLSRLSILLPQFHRARGRSWFLCPSFCIPSSWNWGQLVVLLLWHQLPLNSHYLCLWRQLHLHFAKLPLFYLALIRSV